MRGGGVHGNSGWAPGHGETELAPGNRPGTPPGCPGRPPQHLHLRREQGAHVLPQWHPHLPGGHGHSGVCGRPRRHGPVQLPHLHCRGLCRECVRGRHLGGAGEAPGCRLGGGHHARGDWVCWGSARVCRSVPVQGHPLWPCDGPRVGGDCGAGAELWEPRELPRLRPVPRGVFVRQRLRAPRAVPHGLLLPPGLLCPPALRLP